MKKICLVLFLFVGFFCSAQTYKRIDFSNTSGDTYIDNKLVKSRTQDWILDVKHLEESTGYAKINKEGIFEINGLIGDISFVLDNVPIDDYKLFDISYDLEDVHGLHHYSCLANMLNGELSFQNLSIAVGHCVINSINKIESGNLKLRIEFKCLQEEDVFKLDNIIVRSHIRPVCPDSTSTIKSMISAKYLDLEVEDHQKVLSFSISDLGSDKLPTIVKAITIFNPISKLSDFRSIINNITISQDASLVDVSEIVVKKDSIQLFFKGEGLVIKNNSSSIFCVYADINKIIDYGLIPNLSFMLTSDSFLLGEGSSVLDKSQKIFSPLYELHPLINEDKSILKADFRAIPKTLIMENQDWVIDSSKCYLDRYMYFLRSNALDRSIDYFNISLDDISFNRCDFLWSFNISTNNWNPSSINKFCYYLFADSPEIFEKCNAYAVGVNMESRDDILSLYRIDKGVYTRIAQTSFIWKENESVNIRVERSYVGEWSLSYAKDSQDIVYSESVKIQDSNYTVGLSSGLIFYYSKTRAKGLMIDNINLCVTERREPFVDNFYLGKHDQLCIELSSKVDLSSILLKNSCILTVDNVLEDVENIRIVDNHIELIFPILSGHFNISFKNVKDTDGRNIELEEITFDYIASIKEGEVIINEILSDPNNNQKEFIELYNTTNKDLYLNLIDFKYNGKLKHVFMDYIFVAHSYLILCSNSSTDYLQQFGSCCSVSNFSLAKTSGEVSLTNSEGKVLDKVEYSYKWYDGSPTKGYSLEKINSKSDNDKSNWSSCTYVEGCTPAMVNSVDKDSSYAHLVDIVIKNDEHIVLKFDQAINIESAMDRNVYHLTPDIGYILSEIRFIDEKTIDLRYNMNLSQKPHLILNITGLLDYNGHVINCSKDIYNFQAIYPGEIIINEILSDPNNAQEEFVELYNTTNKDLYLHLINFKYNDKTKYVFRDYIFVAHSYLILCSNTSTDYLQKFGPCCLVSNFSLAKSSGNLSLTNSNEEVIDEVDYSYKWYKGFPTKGYSLEKINPMSVNDESNWANCSYGDGCTPAMVNSVDTSNPYTHLISISIKDERHISLKFDKALDQESITDLSVYQIKPNIGLIINRAISLDKNIIDLEFSSNLPQDITLTINIIDLLDINRNKVNCTKEIYLPKPIQESSLIINEILYLPGWYGIQFLELYNKSENPLDISNIYISDGTSNNISICDNKCILKPKSYLVLTKDKDMMPSFYHIENIDDFIDCDIADILGTDNISIIDFNGRVIDSFDYRKTGVIMNETASLERISLNKETNDYNNWTIGSSNSNWATPGYENDLRELSNKSALEVENSTFRSCFGNKKENLILHLTYPGKKFKVRIDVYNMRGVSANILSETVYQEDSFDFSWNGRLPSGEFVTGILDCVVSITTSEGKIIEERTSIIAA